MGLWDGKYVEFLGKENAELKLQVKKLTDAVLQLKGGQSVYSEHARPRPATRRVSLRDVQGRMARAEIIRIAGSSG